MGYEDMYFYSVYASKYNKETLITLKEEFTFLEMNIHKQFVESQEDLEVEARRQVAEGNK
jgi:hypothetical protein